MNTKPKYLVSTTLAQPRWTNTTVLTGDVAAAIGELKAKPGDELQVHDNGALTRWLLNNDLADKMHLLVVPVAEAAGLETARPVKRFRASSQGHHDHVE